MYRISPDREELGGLSKQFLFAALFVPQFALSEIWFSVSGEEAIYYAQYPYKEWERKSTFFSLTSVFLGLRVPPCVITRKNMAQVCLGRGLSRLDAVISLDGIRMFGFRGSGGRRGNASVPQVVLPHETRYGGKGGIVSHEGKALGEFTVFGFVRTETIGGIVEGDIAVVTAAWNGDREPTLVCVFEKEQGGKKGNIRWTSLVPGNVLQMHIFEKAIAIGERRGEDFLVHILTVCGSNPARIEYSHTVRFSWSGDILSERESDASLAAAAQDCDGDCRTKSDNRSCADQIVPCSITFAFGKQGSGKAGPLVCRR